LKIFETSPKHFEKDCKIKEFMKRLDKIVRQKRESMRYILSKHEIEFIEYLSPEEQMLYYLSK
jgi:hypothetical protein